jgi:glutamine amidotransferase-like uncharacterized protein
MILIYDDGYHSNAHVHMAVSAVNKTPAAFCTASMILDGCLDNTRLLIMPGGADLFNCEKLNGEGNQRIRQFVLQGGSYLGLCAGAYYGCSSLDWNRGEISGPRELALADVCAIGPVYDWVENKESIYEGSWIKAVEIETAEGQKFLTKYNGGPIFQNIKDDIIAHYSTLPNTPPAIIGGTYGKGQYILSSPHIEIFGHLAYDRLYKIYNNSYEREKKEIDELLSHKTAQKQFFQKIIDQLL